MDDRLNFAVLATITMTFALTMILVLPMVPVYASALGATPFGVGLIVAVAPLTSLFFGIPIASLGSHLGLARLMGLGFLLGILSGITYALAVTPMLLIIPQVAFGLTLCFYLPQMINYYYRISTNATRQVMQGYNTAFQGTGALAGPIIAGVVRQYLGLEWVFLTYAILSLMGFLLCHQLKEIPPITADQPLRRIVQTSYRQAFTLIRTREGLQMSLFFGLLMVILWQGLSNTIFPLFIEYQHAGLAMLLGILIAIREFGAILCRLSFAYLCRFLSLYVILASGIGLMVTANLMIPMVTHPVVLGLICFLLGIGLGPMPAGMNLLAMDAVSPKEGPLAMAASSVFTQLGLLIIAPTLGAMVQGYGFENTFYGASFFALMGLIILIRWRIWPRESTSQKRRFRS